MSNLTYLNDASVLHNLRQRYLAKLIYVSTAVRQLRRFSLLMLFDIQNTKALLINIPKKVRSHF